MKAIVYYDVGDFRLEDVATPKIGSKEILVRVRACGICSTDLYRAEYRRAKPGSVLGHEISGEVAEIGSEVKRFNIGDRVAVLHHAPCGACYYCMHAQEPLCDQYRRTNVDPGGFAEYIRVPSELVEKTVVKIPEKMSFEEATMIEPTACAVRAISKSRVSPGDTVLVIGGGPLGLLNAQVAKAYGATQVIVSDHHDFRIKIAEKVGVDYAFNSKKTNIEESVRGLTDGRGADLVVIAVASSSAVQEGLKIVRWGGKVCIFGDFRDVPQPNLDIDPKIILRDDVTILGSWGCAPYDYYAAFNLIKSGRVKVKGMITHKFPLEQFNEALRVISSRECMRVVLEI
ncbi:MAG: zinc-dependent dehydrogenase [Candidatus Bathyarchaeia archaeon]